MIEFISNWAKNIGFTIVIVSMLEMILPNNNTKKYIRIVMGTYVLFCMISPFIKNNINMDDFNFENYVQTSSTSEINQESMNRRIEQLYIEELEKDITKKVQEKGYIVNKCKVEATITNNIDTTKIDKVILNVEVDENVKQRDNIEDKVVSQIQKIKEVNTTINRNENDNTSKNKKTKLTQTEKKELIKFLKDEYEVNEKCLEIS